MSVVNGVLGSVVCSAVGALVWTGVGYTTDLEIGWIAWGIGALAGYGMHRGLGGAGDFASGALAAVIALAGVFFGKYATVHFAVERSLGELEATPIDAQTVRVHLADEVVREWEAEGRELVWPEGMSIEIAEQPAQYPPGVWDEAETRFAALSAQDRARIKKDMEAERATALQAMRPQIASASFQESLGAYDLLWAGLALATAFRIASRRTTEPAEAPEAPAA